ncbi:heme ABC exporter ATP-binding protein CcmA [Elongatibacter sediminis]|uniref:Heme ABC exporter ATP-binding protein CcmA n=1 Tax=Elongatibacter sediminis TaxID=3119006 RepID=A0AAW9RGJ3_9GAMM
MISVDQLVYERFFAPVFQPVSFRLGAGELLRITGANGSGKTTLIRVLAGLLEPTAGRVGITADRIAYVGHQLALKDDLSVEENLKFFSNFMGTGTTSAATAIDALGLRRVAGQLARTLSAGQRKRCALARLLLSPARLWLLDEPYSNLDTEGCSRVDELLASHLARGGACVMATHGNHRPQVPVEDELALKAGTGS